MALNPCKCGGIPIEQIRGAISFDDHMIGHSPVDVETYKRTQIDIHDGNRDDMRVICPKCAASTGWNKQHADGAPGAIAEWTRKKWNELNPFKAA